MFVGHLSPASCFELVLSGFPWESQGVWGSPVAGAVAKRESRVTECFIYGAGLGHLLHKLLVCSDRDLIS